MIFDIGSNLTLLGLLFLAFKYLLPFVVLAALVLLIFWLLPRLKALLAEVFPSFPLESTLLVLGAAALLVVIILAT